MEKYILQHTGNEIDALLEKANISASVEYVDNEIATFDFIKIVDVLPETGLENRFYFVPKVDTQTQDLFDEWAWINNKWEWITTKQIEVDLTPYYTKTEVDSQIASAGFTKGMILMWSGSINTIPTGWALCNGQNGTPNLVDRFIVGAGSNYTIGATGGSDSVILTVAEMPSHTHVATTAIDSGGAHTHTYTGYRYHSNHGGTADTDSPHEITTSKTSSSGSHSHTATTTIESAGSDLAHENRPPYYALAYIMKL